MPVETGRRKSYFTGDGATKVYPIGFPFLSETDLTVIFTDPVSRMDTVQTLATHYTVTGDARKGTASVSFVTAPGVGQLVTIYRTTQIVQEEQLLDNSRLNADRVVDVLDRLTMIAQELKEQVGRAVAVGITSTTSPTAPSAASAVSDVFVGLITGSPSGGLHPFVERELITGGTTWQNLSGGRSGNATSLNGCSTSVYTNKQVFIYQVRDNAGLTKYYLEDPADCA